MYSVAPVYLSAYRILRDKQMKKERFCLCLSLRANTAFSAAYSVARIQIYLYPYAATSTSRKQLSLRVLCSGLWRR